MSTPTPTLIGLTGLAGSGKDTVRAMLEQRGFCGLAFADPIRNMIRDLFNSNGISNEYMDDRALKEVAIPGLGVSYRHLAQTLGTEWGRHAVGADFWLRIAETYMADITTQTFEPPLFVLSDVRFQNEAAWVRERGGVIWRVERPGIPAVRDHASEANVALIRADAVVHNAGSLELLEVLVSGLLGEFEE